MAGIKSNSAEVIAAIKGIASAWDLRAPGLHGRSLGDEIFDIFAIDIRLRTADDQRQPDGQPLAKLAPATLREKRRKGFPATILVREGEMLDPVEIRGRRSIERRSASMTYGVTAEAEKKAEWASEGDPAHNRPARPFYEFDDEAEAASSRHFEAVLEERIKDLGG